MTDTLWLWLGFNLFVLAMLALDLRGPGVAPPLARRERLGALLRTAKRG